MHSKAKRIISTLLLICVVLTLVLSAFFVLSHAEHDCIGEHCPVCAQIHQIENTLKSLFTVAVFAIGLFCLFLFLQTLYFTSQLRDTHGETLIGKKIRINI